MKQNGFFPRHAHTCTKVFFSHLLHTGDQCFTEHCYIQGLIHEFYFVVGADSHFKMDFFMGGVDFFTLIAYSLLCCTSLSGEHIICEKCSNCIFSVVQSGFIYARFSVKGSDNW